MAKYCGLSSSLLKEGSSRTRTPLPRVEPTALRQGGATEQKQCGEEERSCFHRVSCLIRRSYKLQLLDRTCFPLLISKEKENVHCFTVYNLCNSQVEKDSSTINSCEKTNKAPDTKKHCTSGLLTCRRGLFGPGGGVCSLSAFHFYKEKIFRKFTVFCPFCLRN